MAAKEHVNLILTGCGNKNEKEKFKRGSTAAELMRQSDIPVWVVKSGKENKLDNILCPIDFSEPSKYALNNAILLSEFFDANLTILGVFEPYEHLSPRFKVDINEINSHRREETKNKMDEFVKDFDLKGINHKIDIKSGAAHIEILKTIKEEGHDLLVMGTHGRSGINRFVMGSVTEKVTREVPCSFMTTRTNVIIQLKFDNEIAEITEIETHFKKANDLVHGNFYKEAIGKYLICLEINSMHIPSMFKLTKVFKIIGDHAKAEYYSAMAKDVLTRLCDEKIEKEIRKHYLLED
jgi:nucleotide-binding universal stress UspA family protein